MDDLLRMKEITGNSKEFSKIKDLYLAAFPEEERLPFSRLRTLSRMRECVFYAFYDKDKFVGFVCVIPYYDIVYVFYLAVEEKMRSHGYGGMMLSMVGEWYGRKSLVLDIEELNESAPNYEQRLKRRDFYLKNEFAIADYKFEWMGVLYDTLYKGKYFPRKTLEGLFIKYGVIPKNATNQSTHQDGE